MEVDGGAAVVEDDARDGASSGRLPELPKPTEVGLAGRGGSLHLDASDCRLPLLQDDVHLEIVAIPSSASQTRGAR